MDEQIFDPGRAAFGFIDEIECLNDQRAVIDRMHIELGKYGIESWVITDFQRPEGGLKR